jgi:hypothetical protein
VEQGRAETGLLGNFFPHPESPVNQEAGKGEGKGWTHLLAWLALDSLGSSHMQRRVQGREKEGEKKERG